MSTKQSASLIAGLIGCLSCAFWFSMDSPLSADPPADVAPAVTTITDAPGALMRAKLNSSKSVLEGLLRKDFDAVARGAREMKRISEAAEWPRARDDVYEHFSVEFRRQCSQLEALANDLNQEAVKFMYLNITTTCINCHDYVRDSLRVAEVRRRGNVQLIPAAWPQRSTKIDK